MSTTGFCTAHESDRKVGKFADDRRGSRQSRGYDAKWEQTRKRILRRDKGLCQPCKRDNRLRPARQVDHVMSKAEGRALGWPTEEIEADENLQSICNDCHAEKTASEATRSRRGGGG